MRSALLCIATALTLQAATLPVRAQVDALPEEAEADVLEFADVMPALVGGMEGLVARLSYPEEARLAGIQGRVFIQFIVDEQGNATDIHVVRGIGGGCDEAAAAALAESQFEPGVQAGRPVKVRMALPVTFRLTEPPPQPRPPQVLLPPAPEVYEVVDQMPELVHGIEELQARLRYPEAARRAGIEGRVFIQFVVDETGTPGNVRVVRGIGGGCDEAAAEVVRQSRFTPGLLEGRAVKVRLSLPVTFRLR